jgi:mandelate racemase
VLQQPMTVKDGHVMPTEQPGSGVAWDEKAVAKYLVG